ncbi:hypothetical protein [Dyella amyloliquefaciens]|uniref:hypothetical protein n=1 Tax=Dyella amyloliquefaciens TaxID=1770545 RepID=UPI00102EB602|nr:hypothetical protein [Dyella amyloliquefaciens]
MRFDAIQTSQVSKRAPLIASAIALLFASFGAVHAEAPAASVKPMANDAASCEAAAAVAAKPSTACLVVAGQLVDQAHRYYLAGDAANAQPYLERAARIAPEDARVSFEQALVDDASGRPQEARKRYDLLKSTPMAAAAAVPSAVNLVALGRFDDARNAFALLAASQDAYLSGYAQLWQLWLDARSYRGDVAPLREKLARATVGVRAANAQQQALLNLYAGQGSVDAVFAAIDASTPENSLQRKDARTEAALFAGGYLQYVLRDKAAAQRLYRRELPQSGASVERPLIQQSIGSL